MQSLFCQINSDFAGLNENSGDMINLDANSACHHRNVLGM